jgi:hypothetical protein
VSVPAAIGRRPNLFAALFYALLVVCFLGPGLLPGKTLSNSDTLWFEPPWVASKPQELTVPSNPDLGDAPEQMQLFLRHAAREMPDMPLWNPYIVGGRPFHANDQSALFGPYTWPAYVLPFWTALGWIGVLKLWIAAFGTFLLGRSLGMRFAGALLAGVVFALNLKLVTWLIYPAMGVWTWYPWLLLCADRVVKRPDLLSGAALAAVVALQFLTGHPESSFHALLLTVAFFAVRLWQARRRGLPTARRLTRPVLALAGALTGGAALAAVSLIPFMELLVLSADFVDRRGESIDNALPFQDAVGLFLPDFWGRPTQTPFRAILLERAVYVGALPLMLAAAALILRPTRARILAALFGGIAFAVVFGVPPFVQVVTRLPVFSAGHNSRLIVFTLLVLALLAGWGLDQLCASRRTPVPRGRIVLAVAGALLVTPVVIVAVTSPEALAAPRGGLEVAWLFADPPGRFREAIGLEVIRASSLIVWLTVAGAGVLLLALRLSGRLGATAFLALALLVVCVDLFRAGMGQNPAIDREHAEVPRTGAIRFLERQRPARFVSTQEIPQNVIPFEFGLSEARGYDIPIIRRYDRLWRREVVPGAPSVAAGFLDIPLELREVTPRALRALRLLGVTHVLGPNAMEPQVPPFDRLVSAPPIRMPGLTRVYDRPDARVYRLAGALPRAWVVGRQRVVTGEEAALDAITRPGFDARGVVVTEERLSGLPEGGAPDAATGTAWIESYEAERVVLRARSSGPGLVVLNDTHYPGWKAEVDGREAPLERVDYLFRGVRIGAGTHVVEFRYEPLSWRIGSAISVIALTGLIVCVAVGLRRRSTPARVPGSGAAAPHTAETWVRR